MINSVKYWLAILLCWITFGAQASHLAGNDFTYVYLGSSNGQDHYRVTLKIYEDCHHGDPGANEQDNPAFFSVFTGNNTRFATDSVSAASTIPIPVKGPCTITLDDDSACMNVRTFVKDYYLPPSSTGYVIVYQRCCMEANIDNITKSANYGFTAYCNIPPPTVAVNNTSAIFIDPPPFFIAADSAFAIRLAATDADNDSLTYSFCNAYQGGSDNDARPIPFPPPFIPLIYTSPFSYTSPVSCSKPLALDVKTGLLTGVPNQHGEYLISVCCNEWRKGILINTVRREFVVNVLNCINSLPAEVDIYPVPSSGLVTLLSRNEITSIIAYNLWGKKVYSNTYSSSLVYIDISSWPRGVYFLKINDAVLKRLERF